MAAGKIGTGLMPLAQSRTRREAVHRLGAAVLGLGGLSLLASPTAARRRKKRKGGKKRKRDKGGGGGGLGVREICLDRDSCAAGLECDLPTTRHTCSSTVEGVETWCCVPPGGRCTECDCCGDYYCAYDDNNNPSCQPNPEG